MLSKLEMADTQKKTARKGGDSLYNLRFTIYRFWVIKSSPLRSFLLGGEREKKTTIREIKAGKSAKKRLGNKKQFQILDSGTVTAMVCDKKR
jgi:hypothetical protein